MHDCHWQSRVDYGTRYDYGIIPGPWSDRAIAQIERTPAKGWLWYSLKWQRGALHCPNVLKNRAVFEYQDSLSPFVEGLQPYGPTRGLMGIIMAVLRTGARDVVLVGFDTIREGRVTMYAPACRNEPPACLDQPKNKRHHFPRERRLLHGFLNTIDVTLSHAEDVWS
jgi:hypothetical protein